MNKPVSFRVVVSRLLRVRVLRAVDASGRVNASANLCYCVTAQGLWFAVDEVVTNNGTSLFFDVIHRFIAVAGEYNDLH